jgi:hypothetical protein
MRVTDGISMNRARAEHRSRLSRFGLAVAAVVLLVPASVAVADSSHPGERRDVPPTGARADAVAAIDLALATARTLPPSADIGDRSGSGRFGLGVDGGDDNGLIALLRRARAEVRRGPACLAFADLERARTRLAHRFDRWGEDHRAPSAAPFDASDTLAAQVATAELVVLTVRGTEACGGTSTPPGKVTAPTTTMTSGDNHQVTLHITFPAPSFVAESGNGERFLKLVEAGAGNRGSSNVGRPELPVTGSLVAVPQGATTRLTVLHTTGVTLGSVHLWPQQPDAPAATVGGGPSGIGPLPAGLADFTIDPHAYASDVLVPEAAGSVVGAGALRDLSLARLVLPGAHYRALTGSLQVLTSADVRIDFLGDNSGAFATADLASLWNTPFQSIYGSLVPNYAAAAKYLSPSVGRVLCGEEMMLITNTAYQPYADVFAGERTASGVWTRVFVTDGPNGIGTTPTAIRNAIAKQYESGCVVRPSYVALLGNTAAVPTFEVGLGNNPQFFEDPVASDMPYGFLHQRAAWDAGIHTDFSPDVLVGRIPATSAYEAQIALNNIDAYETAPPVDSGFYSHVVGAEFFQACPDVQTNCTANGKKLTPSTQDLTSFTRTSEWAGLLASVAGKQFVRVANDEADNDPGTVITPLTDDHGAGLPSGINWNGSTADITNAINAGAFLMWHSDHGYVDGGGWYEPGFVWNDVTALTNGSLLPVVWSSDCDSGKFDLPNGLANVTSTKYPSYSEWWLERGKGVAAIGASRESPIYQDGFMTMGMAANLFPELGNVLLALFGQPPRQPVRQLGPLLEATKLYMVAQAGGDLTNDVGFQGTTLEYNLFGDPSMAIRRDAPRFIDITTLSTSVLGTAVSITGGRGAANGSLATLVQGGVPIGRGLVTDGTVTITPDNPIDPALPLSVVLNADTNVPVVIPLSAPVPSPLG